MEFIDALGWSQAEFARIADLTPKLVSTIVTGKNPVTPDTAIKLERVLGLKAGIWLNLQAGWELFQAKIEEEKKATSPRAKTWLALFPIGELKARGKLPNTRDDRALMGALLTFLGIGSLSGFAAKLASLCVHHRQSKSFESSPYHVYSWLKLGEDQARAVELPAYDRKKFVEAVRKIRNLTVESPDIFERRMKALCRGAGVALVFEKSMPGTRLFGSARWLDNDHAMIQMSLRLKSNDQFWGAFFHEAAHLVLHEGRNFVDDQDGQGDGFEEEADRWAEEVLIGKARLAEFKSQLPRAETQVTRFSKEVGVHPGIAVGKPQIADKLPRRNFSQLKKYPAQPDD